MPPESSLTRSLLRFTALLAALRNGPLNRPDLFACLTDAYPAGPSMRPMVDRDVKALAELGIRIEISRTRPPLYTLQGGMPVFDPDDLRTLALIRDTFGARHPQTAQVRALIERLTTALTEAERRQYELRQVSRVPLDPAIDYTPYAALIARLESAISRRAVLRFRYQPLGKPTTTLHQRVEPYELEYRDRHFYLVAYTTASRQIHEFRIDRIQDDADFREIARLPPGTEHPPQLITFRYRLDAKLARGEISQRFENQRVVERLPNGDVIIEAEGRSEFFIVRTLLRYAGSAELLEPAWLREQLVAEVRVLGDMYGVQEE